MKKVLIGIGLLLLVVVIGGISLVGWQIVLGPKARAVSGRTFERTEARRARGEYLVENVATCFHCHSEPDLTNAGLPKPGRKGAGWEMPIPELGRVVAPNITRDLETGIGGWTDDEIARAIQEGVNKSGTALFPVMPYMVYDEALFIETIRTGKAVSRQLNPMMPFQNCRGMTKCAVCGQSHGVGELNKTIDH